MYKEDLALNKLQWLICHKTKPNHRNNFRYKYPYLNQYLTMEKQKKNIGEKAYFEKGILFSSLFVFVFLGGRITQINNNS